MRVVAPFGRGRALFPQRSSYVREDARIWEDGGAARLEESSGPHTAGLR